MRWRYLVPRLLVVVVLVGFVRYGLDPTLRFGLERSVELSTGRPTDVDTVQTALWPPRFEFHAFAVSEDDRHDQSEFEVGRAVATLKTEAIKQRRLVVEELRIEDLTWNVPADHEALTEAEATDGEPSEWETMLRDRADAAVRDLVDSTTERLKRQIDPDQLETVRVGRVKKAEYEQLAAGLKSEIEFLKTRTRDLKAEAELIRAAPENFLNPAEVDRLVRAIAELKSRTSALRTELAAAKARLPQDLAEMRAAKDRDVANAKATVAAIRAEPQQLTEALLGEPVARAVDHIATWAPRLVRLRESNDWDDAEVVRHRGRDIDFLDLPPEPSLAIEKCFVSGHARRDGRDWPFQLELADMVAAPRSLRRPVAFRWANGGTTQVKAVGTLAFDGTRSALEAHYDVSDHRATSATGSGEHRWSVAAAGSLIDGTIHLSGDELSGRLDLTLTDFDAGLESDRASLGPLLQTLAIRRPTLNTEVAFSIDPQTKRPSCRIDCTDVKAIVADLRSRSSEIAAAGLAAAKLETKDKADEYIAKWTADLSPKLGLVDADVDDLIAYVDAARGLLKNPSPDAIRRVVADQLDLPPVASELIESPLFETVLTAPKDGLTRDELKTVATEALQSEPVRQLALDAIPEDELQKVAELRGEIGGKVREETTDALADLIGDEAAAAKADAVLGGLSSLPLGGLPSVGKPATAKPTASSPADLFSGLIRPVSAETTSSQGGSTEPSPPSTVGGTRPGLFGLLPASPAPPGGLLRTAGFRGSGERPSLSDASADGGETRQQENRQPPARPVEQLGRRALNRWLR